MVKRRTVCLFLTMAGPSGCDEVRISDRKVEQLIDLAEITSTGNVGPWLGLAPDDSPLLLKDTGTQDIYALDWQEP